MTSKQHPPIDPVIAGYKPEDLLKAPITPPTVASNDERAARALQNPVRRHYAWGTVLVISGLGVCAIGMSGMVLLPLFGFTVTVSLMEVGVSMIAFGLIIHALQFIPGSRW